MPRLVPRVIVLLFGGCLLGLLAQASDTKPLRRQVDADKNEHYPGIAVVYDSIRDNAGHRLRVIATHPEIPKHAGRRFPIIFVVGWLSCDTVEAPPGAQNGTQRMLQAIAQIPGFATVRLEKQGVGDSEGDCATTDFTTELAAYRQAFRHLKDYAFVDPERIFLFGMSNGGGFAPLVAQSTPIRGYVVDGGWIKTWFEHMLEIERRRLALTGHPAAEINTLMTSIARLYGAYLIDRKLPHAIFAKEPELRQLWNGPDDQQYGRPAAYYQQLQDLNLMAAWTSVRVPVLALHGEYDWIMSREDFELLVDLVNCNSPGSAESVELPHTGHTFEHYASQQSAFDGKQLPFDDTVAQRVRDWFIRHQH